MIFDLIISGAKDIIPSIFCLFWLKIFLLYYYIIIRKNNNI